ncbi:hypothetical protein AMTR_s00052p00200910 [Amborella trichopoda]|uniref:Uncharacterized protein n=1 Tax=Amborella trichopoda TaxID=13333 RepID=U5D204_AMBTC|nr:hypothetical protein AMTR_s00052p00200910 [Amborella trichopoda]
MKAVVREPDAVRGLRTATSFFAHERPFPVGDPSDNISINTFSLALNKAASEAKGAMYLISI